MKQFGIVMVILLLALYMNARPKDVPHPTVTSQAHRAVALADLAAATAKPETLYGIYAKTAASWAAQAPAADWQLPAQKYAAARFLDSEQSNREVELQGVCGTTDDSANLASLNAVGVVELENNFRFFRNNRAQSRHQLDTAERDDGMYSTWENSADEFNLRFQIVQN